MKNVTVENIKQKIRGRFSATIVLDRGFDDKKYYDYFSANKINYITRLKINRNVIIQSNGKEKARSDKRSEASGIRTIQLQ